MFSEREGKGSGQRVRARGCTGGSPIGRWRGAGDQSKQQGGTGCLAHTGSDKLASRNYEVHYRQPTGVAADRGSCAGTARVHGTRRSGEGANWVSMATRGQLSHRCGRVGPTRGREKGQAIRCQALNGRDGKVASPPMRAHAQKQTGLFGRSRGPSASPSPYPSGGDTTPPDYVVDLPVDRRTRRAVAGVASFVG